MVVWQVKDFIRTLTPEANTSNLHLKASAAYLQTGKIHGLPKRDHSQHRKALSLCRTGVPSHPGSQQLVILGNKSEITEVFSVSLLFFVLP